MIKKLLSLLLVLCMALSLLPVSALAVTMSGEERAETPAGEEARPAADSAPGVSSGSGITLRDLTAARLMAESDQGDDGSESVTYVAVIGETGYETLQAAIDAANEDETVTLLANVAQSVTVDAGKKLTLELPKGVTLTNEDGKDTITVAQGGALTVVGQGSVNNAGSEKDALVNNGTATLKGAAFSGGLNNVSNTGDLTITGGSFTEAAQYAVMNVSVAAITGGYFHVDGLKEGETPKDVVWSNDRDTLSISGGEFSSDVNDYCAPGYGQDNRDKVNGKENDKKGLVAVHTMTTQVIIPEVPATCGANGTKAHWHCLVCDRDFAEDKKTELSVLSIPETGKHDYRPDTTTDYTAPTCTEPGSGYEKCRNCNTSRPATFTAKGHAMTRTEAVKNTCTESGNNEYYTCGTCKKVFKNEAGTIETSVAAETLAATGHDYVEHAAQAPTCTEIGWNAYRACSRCDYTTYEELAATGHDYADHAAQAPTCTEVGWNAYRTCSRCDYTTYEEIQATGHDYVDHAAQTPTTCTEIGWNAYRTCSKCDYTTYEEIEATGHTVVTDAAVAPTCTATGLTAGSHCSVCGETLTAQEIIPATGHTVAADAAVAPTCTANGLTAGSHCSVCSEVLTAQETVAALGHTVVTDAAVAPTCTATGLTAGSHCSVCNEVLTARETVAALGHSYGEPAWSWMDTRTATATFTCSGCGQSQTETSGRSTCEVTTPPKVGVPGEQTYTATVSFGGKTYTATMTESISALPGSGTPSGGGGGGGGSSSGGGGGGSSSGGGAGAVSQPIQPATPVVTPPAEEDLDDPDVPLADKPFLFEDMADSDWFYDAVKFVFDMGIMEGVNTDKTAFAPQQTSTRASVVTMLHRLEGKPAASAANFPDVAAGAWYTDAVNWATENGIVLGLDDGTFCPDLSVDRQQLVTILFRYATGKGMDTSARADLAAFADEANVSDWAREAMEWAVATGSIKGRNGTELAPQGITTRSELATIFQRFLSLNAQEA